MSDAPLQSIGSSAFYNCSSLSSFNTTEENTLELNDELASIGDQAFFTQMN